VPRGYPERYRAVCGVEHSVSIVRENFFGEGAKGRFVFHEQDCLANAWRPFRNGNARFSDGRRRCFLSQARLGCRAIERLELRRCEELSGENRGTPRCPLNLIQLFGALRILARRSKKKFRVDLDDGQEVVQLVSDVTGGFVGFIQCVRAGIRLDSGFLFLERPRATGGFFQT